MEDGWDTGRDGTDDAPFADDLLALADDDDGRADPAAAGRYRGGWERGLRVVVAGDELAAGLPVGGGEIAKSFDQLGWRVSGPSQIFLSGSGMVPDEIKLVTCFCPD